MPRRLQSVSDSTANLEGAQLVVLYKPMTFALLSCMMMAYLHLASSSDAFSRNAMISFLLFGMYCQ